MVAIGDLPGGGYLSRAYGISADGSMAVGGSWSSGGGSTNTTEAFRWTNTGGMVALGDLPGGSFTSQAFAVSADGSTVVGIGRNASGSEAFRWTSAGGMVALGELPGGSIYHSEARGVSADGSTVVGYSNSSSGREAFVWTSSSGIVGLGDFAGGGFESTAYGISADGSTVVGYGTNATGREAFLWTSEGGIVGLGDLPGGAFFGQAFAASADGSVVVGSSSVGTDSAAFVWDAVSGMRNIQAVLTHHGLDLTGWKLYAAFAVSADGTTIAGYGLNPSGFEEAWVAVLPEPNTTLLLALALAGLATVWRRGGA